MSRPRTGPPRAPFLQRVRTWNEAGLAPIIARREVARLLMSERSRQGLITSLLVLLAWVLFFPIFRAYGHPRMREALTTFPVFAIALQVMVFIGAGRSVWSGMRRDAASGTVDELILTGARVTVLLTAKWLGAAAASAVWIGLALPLVLLCAAITGAPGEQIAPTLVCLMAAGAAGSLAGALVSLSERGAPGGIGFGWLIFQMYFMSRLLLPRAAGSMGPWGVEIVTGLRNMDPISVLPAALGLVQEPWLLKLVVLGLALFGAAAWLAGADQDFPALTRPPVQRQRAPLSLLSLRPLRNWVVMRREAGPWSFDRDVVFRFEWIHGWRTRIAAPFWLAVVALALTPALVAILAGRETQGRERWLLVLEPCLAALFASLGMAASLASEREQGRWVLLLTSPLRDTEIVVAKWRACLLETWPIWPAAALRALLLCAFGHLSWQGALLAGLAAPVAAGTAAAVTGVLCVLSPSLASAQQRALLWLTAPTLLSLAALWLLPGLPGTGAFSLPLLLIRALVPDRPAMSVWALGVLAGWSGVALAALWVTRWQLRRWPPLALLALLTLWPTEGRAAPPVLPQTTPTRGSAEYDAAARRVGFRDWGVATDSTLMPHVLLRLGERDATLTISLPPGGNAATEDAWFRTLSDRLRLRRVRLSRTNLPDATILRADSRDLVRGSSMGVWSGELNLTVLESALSRPALLGVRSDVSDNPVLQPPPLKHIVIGGWQYGFYRLPSGVGRIRLSHVVAARWKVAAWSAVLFWLLFLPCVLVLVRERLRRLDVLPPGKTRPIGEAATEEALAEWLEAQTAHRFALYNWWARGITGAALLGILFCGFVLGIARFFLYVTFGHPEAFQVVLMGALFIPRLIQRLVGLSLEREALPARAQSPWYKIAGVEIGVLIGIGVLFFFIASLRSGTFAQIGATIRRFVPEVDSVTPATWSVLFVGSLVLLWAAAWLHDRSVWRRRRQGPLKGEEAAPTDLAAEVTALTTQLDCPVQRVYVSQKVAYTLTVIVRDEVAIFNKECLSSLKPEETVSLIAAAAAYSYSSRKDWVERWGGWAAIAPIVICGLGFLIAVTRGGRPPAWVMTVFAVYVPAIVMLSVFLARRTQRRREESDLRVADALPDSRILIRAIETLNRIGLTAAGAAGSPQTLPGELRLQRLKDRLGLD